MEPKLAPFDTGLELYLEEFAAEPLGSSVAAATAATFLTGGTFFTAGSTASSVSSGSSLSSATG
jgi:hypothetical protein